MKAASRKTIELRVSENENLELWEGGVGETRGAEAGGGVHHCQQWLCAASSRSRGEHWHFYLSIECNLCDGRAASALIFLTRIIPVYPPLSVSHTAANTHSHNCIHSTVLKSSLKMNDWVRRVCVPSQHFAHVTHRFLSIIFMQWASNHKQSRTQLPSFAFIMRFEKFIYWSWHTKTKTIKCTFASMRTIRNQGGISYICTPPLKLLHVAIRHDRSPVVPNSSLMTSLNCVVRLMIVLPICQCG